MENNQCRLCLSTHNKNFLGVLQNEFLFNIVELIKHLFNIVISENDNFSKFICYSCFMTLDNFNNYSEKVKLNNSILIKNYQFIYEGKILNTAIQENDFYLEIKVVDTVEKNSVNSNEIGAIYEQTTTVKEENNIEKNDTNDENNDNDEDDDEFSPDKDDNISESDDELQTNTKKSPDSSHSDTNIKKGPTCTKFPETLNDIKIKKFYKYECDLCKNHGEINTFRVLRHHYKSKHGIAAYVKCCGKRFTRPYSLVEHIDEHLTPESLICPTCNKKLRTKQTLLSHMDMHVPVNERPLKCKYCDMRFVRNRFLIQHEKVHLTDDQLKYICDLCGKRFPTDWRLKTHLNSTHSDLKPFFCEVCAKSFKLKVQLQNHMFVHNKNEAFKKCEHCGFWLKSPRSYYVHMKEKHDASTPKSFPCDKCKHISPTKKALYAHCLNKHGPKKHKCIHCSEAFSSSNLLKSHMIKHTGPGEPLKCPFCPKTFSFRSGYYSHKKKVHLNLNITGLKDNNSA